MLSSNWIAGFFDHQYLQKEFIDFLYFLMRNSHPLVGCAQPCWATPKVLKLQIYVLGSSKMWSGIKNSLENGKFSLFYA